MNASSISSLVPQFKAMSRHAFCVDPAVLEESRSDDTRVVVPKPGVYYGMAGIEECGLDFWGEETCTQNTRFRPVALESGFPEQSCTKAQKRDPGTFEYMRRVMEISPWTNTEMKKAMKWVFNCTGRIPVKNCSWDLG
jgi:hypothetical protein